MKLFFSLMVFGTFLGQPMEPQSLPNDQISVPFADQYVWKTKVENGHTYIRKYNITKGRWEGPWIRVN